MKVEVLLLTSTVLDAVFVKVYVNPEAIFAPPLVSDSIRLNFDAVGI